jgi:hypothetical protein
MRNSAMSKSLGFDIWYMDGIDMSAGEAIELTFESTNSPRRQGIFIATEGLLTIAATDARAFTLWADTAPTPLVIRCRESKSGTTVLYNIYEHPPGREMSQSYTSGMLIDALPDGERRYRCCDVGSEPVFDRLVFSIHPVA